MQSTSSPFDNNNNNNNDKALRFAAIVTSYCISDWVYSIGPGLGGAVSNYLRQ